MQERCRASMVSMSHSSISLFYFTQGYFPMQTGGAHFTSWATAAPTGDDGAAWSFAHWSKICATQRCTRDKGQAFLGVFYSYTVLQTPTPEQDINNKSADMHIICKEFSNRTPTIKHCMNSCVMGWMKLVIKKKYFECSVRVVTCYLKPECVFAWNRNAYVPMFR